MSGKRKEEPNNGVVFTISHASLRPMETEGRTRSWSLSQRSGAQQLGDDLEQNQPQLTSRRSSGDENRIAKKPSAARLFRIITRKSSYSKDIKSSDLKKRSKHQDDASERDDVLSEPLHTTQHIDFGEYENSSHEIAREAFEQSSDTEIVPLFCEMLTLHRLDDGENMWREFARWIKYEETVEEDGRRWSKPHITLLNMTAIMQLKNCFRRGVILLDSEHTKFENIVEEVVRTWQAKHDLDDEEAGLVKDVLVGPREHLLGSGFRPRGRNSSSAPALIKRIQTIPIHHHHSKEKQAEEDEEEVDDSDAPEGLKKVETKSHIAKKLPPESNAVVSFVSRHEELHSSLVALVRLKNPSTMPNLPEMNIPVKFVFFLLGGLSSAAAEIEEVGKAFNVLMVDEVFCQIAQKARSAGILFSAVDEFLGQTTTIPAGKFSKDQRMEPSNQAKIPPRNFHQTPQKRSIMVHHDHSATFSDLQRTGRIFGGLINDIKRKSRWYVSDYKDAVMPSAIMQCIAATIFLFLTNVTKIITFGGVMGLMLNNEMATIENLLSGGICGVLYAIFAGQPMACLSATGPTLVFEFIMYRICLSNGWAFLAMRFWVGVWTCVIMLTFVACDANALVAYVTKFTEEAFATLISIIYIWQAFEEMLKIGHVMPITTNPVMVLDDECICDNRTYPYESVFNGTVDIEECKAKDGAQCNFFPDVFLFAMVLFFCTFFISYGLKLLRHSSYLPSKLRNTIADFNVLIAVVSMTVTNLAVGLKVPRLAIPTTFAPTSHRPWIVNPLDIPWWLGIFAFIPALLFSILVIMDQNITSVIVNRKENRLRKSYGYHLDLAVVSLLMIPCCFLGIPFYVAATVISIMHVDSLKLMSQSTAPGEKPQFLGVREQRVTALVAHLLIGMTVVLSPVIKLIPLPVLLGIFLYMGIVSLKGQQFVQRFGLFFMPVKYQPDYKFLRLVPLKRVHLFTLIQILGLVLLFLIKKLPYISIMFPVTLIVLMGIRKLLERLYSNQELLALDDPLPPFKQIWYGDRANKEKNVTVRNRAVQWWQKMRTGNRYDMNGQLDTTAAFV